MVKISSKNILMSSGLLTFIIVPGTNVYANKKADTQRPNVIYILADDLGIGDLGCYGQRVIKTPGIDKLADSGMRFTQHYSGSTVSAPSRCVLMTGKHTGHADVRGNRGYKYDDGHFYDTPLKSQETTVAEIFKQRNYKTACIGKWGLGGPNSEGHPNNQGFDYFFGYLSQGNAHTYYPERIFENNTPVILNKKVYSHDLIVEKAMDFIDKNSSEPFFLYLPVTIPHAELVVPEKDRMGYLGKFPETPYVKKGSFGSQEFPQATFAAMVSRLDKNVQQIVDLLKEKNLYENTIIMFSSDNGIHKEGGIDPDYFDSNGPFRGYKRDLYEGGIRSPFIVSWPAVVPNQSISYHKSAAWDLLPTICDIIGVPKPKGIDGISYLPTIKNKGKQKEHKFLYFEFHEQGGKQALLKDGWKLIRLDVSNPNKTRFELYNYFADPGETADVSVQYPEKVKELSQLMDKQRTPDERWIFKKIKD